MELFCSRSPSMFLVPLNMLSKTSAPVWSKQGSFFLGTFRYKVKHNQTIAAWIRYLEMNFVEVATASRKCSDVFKFRPRLNSHVSRFKAISWSDRALFKLHIFKRKSLQRIWLKTSRKSDPRASVLNNPLYNGKICAYVLFEEIPSLTLTRVVCHTVDTTKTVIFNVKSLHLIMILIYFI